MFLRLFVKDIIIHPDVDGIRNKWVTKILEFNLEIKPTKLVKGKGLSKLLVESNCKYLGVNFIKACSENQRAEISDKNPQDRPPLAECT
jgi:hypothetical protein